MNVALFTDTYLPDINGVVTSVELLRKKLAENGHNVYVVCTHTSPLGIKREGNIIRLPGIEIKKLYGYSIASPAHFLLIDDLRDCHFDVIHAHTEFGVGIFAEIVARVLNIPLVRTYHTTYEDYTHYVNPINSKTIEKVAKKAVSSFTRLYGKSCLRLISPSKKTADMLVGYGIDTPIEIIPTGIELNRFYRSPDYLDNALKLRKNLGIAETDSVFLYVGRLAEEKSVDMIIEAFSLIEDDSFKLVIVGGGPQEKDLQKLAANDNRIIFTGKIPFENVPSYYHFADAFISASTSETQGMTYIEALASSLAVFGRDDEVVRDIVIPGTNGYIFSSAKELANQLVEFAHLDIGKRKQLSANSVSSIAEYDSDLFVEKVLAVYHDAIEAFSECYTIKKTKLKEDSVVLTLSQKAKEENLLVSLDDYVNLGLRSNSLISSYDFDKLKKKEKCIRAYQACLRKLASRDYSISNMKSFLLNNYGLSSEQIDSIIEKLVSINLLDDSKYALSRINSFENTLYSQKKIRNKLIKDGISQEIIDQVIIQSDDLELMKARKMAEKYRLSVHNKSIRMKKQTIYNKLVAEGYSYETAEEVMKTLDLSSDIVEEKDILKKEAYKLKKKYEKKYQSSELRNRIFMALQRKGFPIDSIYAIINEMED